MKDSSTLDNRQVRGRPEFPVVVVTADPPPVPVKPLAERSRHCAECFDRGWAAALQAVGRG